MATVHECDRCSVRIQEDMILVRVTHPRKAIQEIELCTQCYDELMKFAVGCAIPESYRRGPREVPK